ncbi:MAG: hypothetical protein ABIO70_26685 [Pseudomonadota bacterium]
MILAFLSAALATPSPLHPAVPLLDAQEQPVAESLAPVSPMQTCGACHDTDYIAAHGYHTEAGLDDCLFERLRRATGARHVGGGSRAATVELDCFLCHLDGADVTARRATLAAGQPAWAATATLANTGLVEPAEGDTWRWREDTITETAAASIARLPLQTPTAEACGACHGAVWTSPEPLQLDLSAACSSSTGQVFSGQRISDSALPLAGKEDLTRPWDVHAEHLLDCAACHPAPNDPTFFFEPRARRPAHLRFDARRPAIGDFLERPSHQLAKGRSVQAHVADSLDDSMRRCEDCHDATREHAWLPRRGAHLKSLACEACHVPRVYAPARESLDWTLPTPEGQPRQRWRGVQGDPEAPDALFTGFEPLLLFREDPTGPRLYPTNLTTVWFWVQGEDGAQVDPSVVASVAAPAGAWDPALLAMLDADHDGAISDDEAALTDPEAVRWLQSALTAAGVPSPRVQGELRPFGLHHGVVGGPWATRTCDTCHVNGVSQLHRSVALMRHAPAGAPLSLERLDGLSLPGAIERRDDGAIVYTTTGHDLGLYLPGGGSEGWVDRLGFLALLGALAGAAGHGGLRFLFRRRETRGRAEPVERRES